MLHLTTDQKAFFLDNKLSKQEKQIVIQHLLDCNECYHDMLDIYSILNEKSTRGNLELNHHVKETALSFGVYINERKPRSNFFSKQKLIFSFAAIFIVICLFLIFDIDKKENPKQFRDQNTDLSLQIITPAEETVISKKNIIFEWDNIDDAFLYRVVIYSETGNVLLDTSISKNSIDLTGKLNFKDNTKYFWDVKAIFTNGQVITSKLNAFSIK